METEKIQKPVLTLEKSTEIAQLIELSKLYIIQIDEDYLQEYIKESYNQINRQRTLAVLNPSYPEKKNVLLDKQTEALQHLLNFIKCLKVSTKLKEELKEQQDTYSEIAKMFI